MRKKIMSIILSLCLLSCSSLTAFAEKNPTEPVDQYGYTYSDYLNADPWWKDAMLCSIEYGNGEMHILENYTPKNDTPFLSFTDPYNMEGIPAFLDERREHEVKNCEICGEAMLYVDILYEINPNCGHAIFSYGYYCAADNTFISDFFYDQCGCYAHNVKKIHPHMIFVKEVLEK